MIYEIRIGPLQLRTGVYWQTATNMVKILQFLHKAMAFLTILATINFSRNLFCTSCYVFNY